MCERVSTILLLTSTSDGFIFRYTVPSSDLQHITASAYHVTRDYTSNCKRKV